MCIVFRAFDKFLLGFVSGLKILFAKLTDQPPYIFPGNAVGLAGRDNTPAESEKKKTNAPHNTPAQKQCPALTSIAHTPQIIASKTVAGKQKHVHSP
jgi:hypothetical protein